MTNYYNEIKEELLNKEIFDKVKDFSKQRNELNTYYNIGKILYEAGKSYGDNIILKYSNKLKIDIGKKYNITLLKRIRQFYLLIEKGATLWHQLSFSHYRELLPISDIVKVNYYINISIKQNLSVRELHEKIKSQEYERLDNKTKEKLIKNEDTTITDFVKNPIIIKSNIDKDNISEKILQTLILENIDNFLKELGLGFCYIGNEYKIKLGNRYNYIDILLFNITYNCYVVIELKVTELKKEHLGQIHSYMNYIDKNIKSITHNNTIGIIICKKDNKFVMEYCSDDRIFRTTYLIN